MVQRNTSVVLGEHFDAFVRELLKSGRYANASEVMRSGLRLLEEHETKVRALRDALADGERTGDAGELDFDAIRRAARSRVSSGDGKSAGQRSGG